MISLCLLMPKKMDVYLGTGGRMVQKELRKENTENNKGGGGRVGRAHDMKWVKRAGRETALVRHGAAISYS